MAVCKAVVGYAVIRECDKDRLPEKKPCGRLAWSVYLQPECIEGPYLDISVMPKNGTHRDEVKTAPKMKARRK